MAAIMDNCGVFVVVVVVFVVCMSVWVFSPVHVKTLLKALVCITILLLLIIITFKGAI